MDESALRISLAILEMRRSSLSPLLELCTWLVVVGLLVDGFVIVSEYVEGLHDFRRGVIHPPERPSAFLLLLGLGGTFLIAGGVAGELFFQSKIGTIETEMRLTSDRIVVLVSTEAGDAKTSAKGAADAGHRANASARQANGEAESAKERVEEVVKEAAELRKQNLDLAQKLVSMEKAAFPRYLRQGEFATKLRSIKGFPVIVEIIPDFEAQRTAAFIQGGIQMANWQVGPIAVNFNPLSVPDFLFPGVRVARNCGINLPLDRHPSRDEWYKSNGLWTACDEAYESLIKELNANGIEAREGLSGTDIPYNTIRVRVGLKPMPGQAMETLSDIPTPK